MDHLKKTFNSDVPPSKPTSNKRAMVVDHSLKDKLQEHGQHSPGMLKKYSQQAKKHNSFSSKQRTRYSEAKQHSEKICTKILDQHLPPALSKPLKQAERELYDQILSTCKAKAAEGLCLLRKSDLQAMLVDQDKKYELEAEFEAAAASLTNQALLKETQRVFCEGLVVLRFFTLTVEAFSLECLQWVLKSMETDRMMPSEKNIQNRVKEQYDIKVNLDLLTRRVAEVNEIGRRKAVVATFEQETLYDEQKNACNFFIWPAHRQQPEDQAQVDPGDEPSFATAWLFLLAQLSHNLRSADFEDGCISEARMAEIVACDQADKVYLYRNLKPEVKVQISGGKQGCACFLKQCGPRAVRALSIGLLNSYVQKMLDIDSIRYDSTCLVLTYQEKNKGGAAQGDNDSRDLKQRNTLEREQDRLITRLVQDSRDEGVSLAQLPILIRQKQGRDIDVKFLGFAKLKDFIARNEGLEIQNKGPNQPHVRCVPRDDHQLSRKSSRESLGSVSDSTHDLVDKVLNIIKFYLFSHITLDDIVGTFASLQMHVEPDTVRAVVLNHLTAQVDVSYTPSQQMILRLKSPTTAEAPINDKTMAQELEGTQRRFHQSYSEGCKTPSNDNSQFSEGHSQSSHRKVLPRAYAPWGKHSEGVDALNLFYTDPKRQNSSQTESKDDLSCSQELDQDEEEVCQAQPEEGGGADPKREGDVDEPEPECIDSSSLTQVLLKQNLDSVMDEQQPDIDQLQPQSKSTLAKGPAHEQDREVKADADATHFTNK